MIYLGNRKDLDIWFFFWGSIWFLMVGILVEGIFRKCRVVGILLG